MSSPMSDGAEREEKGGTDGHDREVAQNNHGADHVDPNIEKWRERSRERKREMFRKLEQGAAFGTGKELAEQYDLAGRFSDFLKWLGELL